MAEIVLYVARDKDNTLCMYGDKPEKHALSGIWASEKDNYEVIMDGGAFPSELFKDVKWGDDEPHKIKLTMEDIK